MAAPDDANTPRLRVVGDILPPWRLRPIGFVCRLHTNGGGVEGDRAQKSIDQFVQERKGFGVTNFVWGGDWVVLFSTARGFNIFARYVGVDYRNGDVRLTGPNFREG